MHMFGRLLTGPDASRRTNTRGARAGRRIRPLPLVPLALLLAAALIAGLIGGLIGATVSADLEEGEIQNMRLSSDAPGTLAIRWDTPSPAPSDYRIVWAPADRDFLSWSAPNEALRGNEYPGGSATSLTLTGLTEGTEFKAGMRARYRTGEHEDDPWSGPWTATVTQRVRADAPAAPTGLTVREQTDKKGTTVELSWTAPGHGGLTGYRIRRGAGALTVLVEDTGDTSTKYTDGTAEADTSYTYAVTALSPDGDSPRSETASLVRRRTKGTPTPTPTPTPAPGEIATLTISSEAVGVMSFDWSEPDPAPDRYLINWNESHLSFPPLEDRNGNFYSTHIGMTFGDTIVEPGKTYKLRVRADYTTGDGAPWQGPWSETVVQRVRNDPPQAPGQPAGGVRDTPRRQPELVGEPARCADRLPAAPRRRRRRPDHAGRPRQRRPDPHRRRHRGRHHLRLRRRRP